MSLWKIWRRANIPNHFQTLIWFSQQRQQNNVHISILLKNNTNIQKIFSSFSNKKKNANHKNLPNRILLHFWGNILNLEFSCHVASVIFLDVRLPFHRTNNHI